MSRTMRSRTAIGMHLLFFLVPGLCGNTICYAQQPAKPDVPFPAIREILKELTRRKYLLYNAEILDQNLRVSLALPLDAPVRQLLDSGFSGLNYTYEVTNAGISFGYLHADTSSPYKHLEDTLTDETGKPLIGATVTGNGSSVETDADGHFSLRVREYATWVEMSCIGYRTEYRKLPNKTSRRITMHLAATNLDVAMVNGYGNTTQRKNPGDVFPLRNSDLGYVPAGNLLDGLSGRAPGFYDRVPNGVPGTAHITTLDGYHSIFNGNNISYILDDVPLATDGGLNPIGTGSAQGIYGAGVLNFIPTDLVDSVSLLKDASAMAIYGSWAANGVILMTLKRAKPDSMVHWTADFNQAIGHVLPTSRMLSTPEFLQLRQEAVKNDGLTPGDTTVPELKWGNRQNGFQHFSTGGTARISNARLTFNGGSPTVYYLASANLHRETSVFPGATSDERNTVYANLHIEPVNKKQNKPLQLVLSLLYTWEGNRLPIYDYTGDERLAPNTPPFYNSARQLQWSQESLSFLNIPAQANNAYTGNVYTLFGHTKISWQVNRHLSLDGNLGYNGILTSERAVQPKSGQDPNSMPAPTGTITLAGNQYSRYIMEALGRWDSWIGQGEIKGVLGVDRQGRLTSFSSQIQSGYTDDQLLNAGLPAPQIIPSENKVYYQYAAIFAKLDYVAYDRYLLTASWRWDGSSRFGPGNQFGNFWAVATGWIFSGEPFLRGSRSLSYGKIRASLGTTGNDQIVDGGYAEVYGQGPAIGNFPGQQGVVPVSLANTHLRWEQNYRAEAAMEFGFWKNRLLVSVIAFRNWSTNQVINAPVAPVAGLSAVWSNQPVEVVNEALEMVLETSLLSTRRLTWKTMGTITIPRNELVRWPGLASSQYANTYVLGKSLTVTKGYHSTGVDTQTGVYTFRSSNPGGTPRPGDEVPDAGLDPRWYAGWSHQLRFDDFELGLLLDLRWQNAINPLILLARQNPPGEQAPSQLSNGPAEWLDHWKKPGDHAAQQRPTVTPGSPAYNALQTYLQSDAWSIDGSYIRLKSVSITYHLPASLLKKLRLHGGKLYASAQNVWTHTHYPVTDPETQDPLALPPLRVISAGICISL